MGKLENILAVFIIISINKQECLPALHHTFKSFTYLISCLNFIGKTPHQEEAKLSVNA